MTAGLWTPEPAGTNPIPESNFRWATVASVIPLTIRFDGDSDPVAAVPDVIVGLGNIKPGDRVWTQMYNRRVVVLGASGVPGSGAKIESLLQLTMSGGGVRTVDSTGVSWSQRLILMGAGQGDVVGSGFFDISMPPDGTVIPVHSSALETVTVASGVVPLTIWQALYYDVPLGSTSASDPSRFHIVYYTGGDDFIVPPSYMLVAVRNGDSLAPAYRWGDGRAQDYWRTFTLQNSWVAYGLNWPAPAWKFGLDGRIYTRGLMKNGTVGAVPAITLSAGLGPDGSTGTGSIFNQPCDGGTARVDVHNDGQIQVQSLSSGATTAFVSLDNVAWWPAGS